MKSPRSYNKKINLGFDNNIGYYRFYDPEHPLAEKQGRVWYHRHVISQKIDRWIEDDEHVHHIDENKKNNEWENLQLVTRSEHASIHSKPLEDKKCKLCKKKFKPDKAKRKYCSPECSARASSKYDIDYVYKIYLECGSFLSAGKKLGISDVAIKKRLKKANLIK